MPPSQRSDARQNRAHLLATARALAEARGEVPAFNELARAAKVGVGTVYRHFADEHALRLALVEGPLAELHVRVDEALRGEDAGAALARMFRLGVALVLEQPLVARVLAGSPAEADAMEAKIAAVLERARRAGRVRRDVVVGDVRRLICGIELAARSGEHPSRAAERYVAIVLAGLRPEGEAAPARRASKARPKARASRGAGRARS